ncbi:MAG: TIGR01212 family radical SAM protein [Candidatus Heimdallarchaeota archaeon]|nr:TIGR01212 family radical SAM protein [Candidatus Heimdallarchaeota archaeon]
MNRLYYSFNEYLRQRYQQRVHRISLNAGFSCPSRDGTLDTEGCIFCNEAGFAHFSGESPSLEDQIIGSMEKMRVRFKCDKFIAYFQNATNTYACVEVLKQKYDVIRKFPEIVGLTVSTRPDCVDQTKLDLLDSYSEDYEVWIEYGLQSIHEKTLKTINRLHSTMQFLQAIEITAKHRIKIGVHVVLGLLGETKEEMMETAEVIAKLPIDGIKLHVLHVLKDTKLEQVYRDGKIQMLKQEEYVSVVCDFLERIPKNCVIMRLVSNASPEILVAPEWINQKAVIVQQIEKEFIRRGTYQGIKNVYDEKRY